MIRRTAGLATAVILLAAAPSQAWAGSVAGSPHRPAEIRAHSTSSLAAPPAADRGSGAIGLLPRVLVGGSPQAAVFDPAFRTVYVANQGDNTLSMVNARTCNARRTTGCSRMPPTTPAGDGPFFIGINSATHTLYVSDANSNTVTVINSATCNATTRSGCGQKPVTMTVGNGPSGVAVDQATDTVYVTNSGDNTVSVINGATCNATVTTGCGQKPPTVHVGQLPLFATLDQANHTLYVTNANDSTFSMIDAATCNAQVTSGCGSTPPTVKVGAFPIPMVVDRKTDTIYLANGAGTTVSVINGATCNATTTSGCNHPRVGLQVPTGPDGLALNQVTDTLFVSNSGGDFVSVVDAATCNAQVTSGCDQRVPKALTGENPGRSSVDEATNTLYVPTLENTVQIVNGATCNAQVRTGCGQPIPATPGGPIPFATAINQATNTVYVSNLGGLEGSSFNISVINAATCNTTRRAGCTPTPATVPMPFGSLGVAVDQATNTVYASDSFAGQTVSVINGAKCNGTIISGCGTSPPTAKVGSSPDGLAVDEATHTLYVANGGSKSVSVINTATCNAQHTTGCGKTPPHVALGQSPFSVAVNQATNTIYVLNPGTPATVSVINGATCNATVTTGCGQVPPSVTAGNDDTTGIASLAVDQATDTIYAVNTGDDTVSVINGATCNARVTTGCGQTPHQVRVGRQFYSFVTVDPVTDLIYVPNNLDDTVSVINGKTCNGADTSGCGQPPPAVPAGGGPQGLAVIQTDHTVYIGDGGAGQVSFFRFQAPQRPTGVVATAHNGKVDLRWERVYAGGLPVIYQVIPTPACPACRGLTTPSTSGLPFTTITGPRAGQRYRFKVRATDAAGAGPRSAPSNPVTP